MDNVLARLTPFKTREARRLALLFAVVYLSQGMWYLPNQAITIALKDVGLGAAQVAWFFTLTTLPWVIKPVYGLISDFVPLFGQRRKSYFLLTTLLAAVGGGALVAMAEHAYWWLAAMVTLMGLGIAFTDVLTDALMVANGKPLGLTGAFQATQWAAIMVAQIIVGIVGGYFAERHDLHGAFAVTAAFPLLSFVMALVFVREPREEVDRREAFTETWAAIVAALGEVDVRIVAAFLLFWAFSPSYGTALLFYQTDVLKLSQQFIGYLAAVGAVGAIGGAVVYGQMSRRLPLRKLVQGGIAVGVLTTLLFLFYRDARSAVLVEVVNGFLSMISLLAFLDLAAKACPRRVEATFFATLMSIYNLGQQGAQILGGHLYDKLGYLPLILISSGATALAWIFVPFVRFERIEQRARESGD